MDRQDENDVLDSDLERRIEDLIARTTLTREEIMREALRAYLDWQEEFVRDVRAGIAAADRGDVVPHEEVDRDVRARLQARVNAPEKR